MGTDDDVYREMKERIAGIPDTALTHSLREVAEILAPGAETRSVPESTEDDPIPDWLRTRLMYTAGLRHDQLEGISGEEAMILWGQFLRRESL